MDRHHREVQPGSKRKPFNCAIWLYDMNADLIFDNERHLIVDSSLGLIEAEASDWESGRATLFDSH